MTRRLLAVDLSNQVYKAVATHMGLTADGVFTGGLYGFIVSLAAAVRRTNATHVVICQDRKPYIRSQQYPLYKKIKRKPPEQEIVEAVSVSMRLILEFAEVAGLPVWGIDGFESDDLIAHCVHKYRHRFGSIYAMSGDSDLGQLFWCERFFLYTGGAKGAKGTATVHDRHSFFKPLDGITTEQYVLMLALKGTHNDVEGIARVGDKTALAAVKDPGKLRPLREAHAELIERNISLIQLPHPAFPRSAELPVGGCFDIRALYRWAARYDIDITRGMEDAFGQLNKE